LGGRKSHVTFSDLIYYQETKSSISPKKVLKKGNLLGELKRTLLTAENQSNKKKISLRKIKITKQNKEKTKPKINT
jgi:hypothetical protein